MSLTPAESSALPDSLPSCPVRFLLIALTIFLPLLCSLVMGCFGQLSDWLNTQVAISLGHISPEDQIQAPWPSVLWWESIIAAPFVKDNVIYLFSGKHNWPYLHTKFPLAGNESHLGTRHSSSLCLCQGTAEKKEWPSQWIRSRHQLVFQSCYMRIS